MIRVSPVEKRPGRTARCPFAPNQKPGPATTFKRKMTTSKKIQPTLQKTQPSLQKMSPTLQKKIPAPERSAGQRAVLSGNTRLNVPGRHLCDNLANFFARQAIFAENFHFLSKIFRLFFLRAVILFRPGGILSCGVGQCNTCPGRGFGPALTLIML